MRMYDLIEKKRNGETFTKQEIHFFIQGYTKGKIPDYQMSALLMAIYFQGMTDEEQAILTEAMVESGEQIDLSPIQGIKVDKHSTGGVGDTTSIILAPLVATLEVPVAKMSGRGLGHTGGTIDKLESIPGFHVEISNEKFIDLVNQNKLAVISQSGNLTPADQKIYQLRDVTATVDSIPLIASSIMSKKIAAGANKIVLDVKVGKGAFMKTVEDAKKLAKAMVSIGTLNERETIAMITDMNEPLGYAIGNALEIKEAILTLKGEGPKDLTELCLALGSHMVVLAKRAKTVEEARKRLEEKLSNGEALEKFRQFVRAQGGDDQITDDLDRLPKAEFTVPVVSEQAGYIHEIEAEQIGKAALMLGAGRETQESTIDLAVGIELKHKIGAYIEKGDVLATIHANEEKTQEIETLIKDSIHYQSTPIKKRPLIYEVIQ